MKKKQKLLGGIIAVILLFNMMTSAALAGNGYTVIYNANGADSGSVPTDINSYQPGGIVTVLDRGDLAKTGYSFVAWNTYADGTGTSYLPPASFNITDNTTLYAYWSLNTYTVVFDPQGGQDAPSISDLVYGSTISPPAWDQFKYGYIFAGWYKEASCTNEWDFDRDTVTDNITLYAKWTPSPLYTVNFDKNGGDTEAVPTAKNAVYGVNVVTLPEAPARTGWTFTGWNTAADRSGAAFTESTAVTTNTTVYAQWTINTYTVSFNSNGGSAVDNQTVSYNGTATRPADPARASSIFAGWYLDEATNNSFNFSTPITADITLFARWSPNNGGGSSDSRAPGVVFSDPRAAGVNKPVQQVQQELQQAGVRDVKPTDWFAGSVTVLIQSGLLKPSSDGSFKPEAKVTGGEGTAVFAKVLGIAAKDDTPEEALTKMKEAGLVDNNTSIDRDFSRVELARLLGKALGVEPKVVVSPADYPFADFDAASPEDRGIMRALYDLGIFKGYLDNGVRTFRPDNILTRAEVAILVDRILGAN